jgi:hypothetical protein
LLWVSLLLLFLLLLLLFFLLFLLFHVFLLSLFLLSSSLLMLPFSLLYRCLCRVEEDFLQPLPPLPPFHPPLLLSPFFLLIPPASPSFLSLPPSLLPLTSIRDQITLGECEIQPKDPIYLGRVDYHLQAIDRRTHKQAWNITLGEFISPEGPVS